MNGVGCQKNRTDPIGSRLKEAHMESKRITISRKIILCAATMGMDRHILKTSNKILYGIWLWRDFLWQEWH